MAYGKKTEEKEFHALSRVKDYTALIPGQEYHLRKIITQEGSVLYDEVYDAIFKELKDGLFIEVETETEFPIGGKEFEIFIRRKL